MASFDSIDRKALGPILYASFRALLRSWGLPYKVIELTRTLYTVTSSYVRVEGEISDWFRIDSGVGHWDRVTQWQSLGGSNGPYHGTHGP